MRRIVYAPEAKDDLEQIFAYLDEYSTSAATKLAIRINQRVGVVAAHPGIGRDRGDLIGGMRSVVVDKYVIFYRFTDTELEILRVINGFRDIDSIFQTDSNGS
jgi:toxin ParE1/3/4